MKKVIFYNPYADGDIKGALRRIFLLAEILNANNIKYSIVDSKINKLIINKSKFLKFIELLGLKRLNYYLVSYFLCKRYVNYVVISEVIVSPVYLDNFILTIHDLKAFEKGVSRRGGWLKFIYILFIKLARKIIVVSNFTKDELTKLIPQKKNQVHVVRNGLSKVWIKNAKESKEIKIFDFVYVSSFAKHKGHLWLINNLPKGSRVLLVGRDLGVLEIVRDAVKNRSAEIYVEIRTDINNDEQLIKVLDSAKIGIFPSEYEGFGIPILEYASLGLPIIASDIPPFRELAPFIDHYISKCHGLEGYKKIQFKCKSDKSAMIDDLNEEIEINLLKAIDYI
jgi:glycosyltransferase involved in cell wall biosynthesis